MFNGEIRNHNVFMTLSAFWHLEVSLELKKLFTVVHTHLSRGRQLEKLKNSIEVFWRKILDFDFA